MYIREFGIPHILEICEIVHTNELVKLGVPFQNIVTDIKVTASNFKKYIELDAMEYEVKGCKQETLLLIEESDLDDKIASKLRGNHVDYIIAPLSAKDNEDFMKQALCCISISGIYWGQILYYT